MGWSASGYPTIMNGVAPRNGPFLPPGMGWWCLLGRIKSSKFFMAIDGNRLWDYPWQNSNLGNLTPEISSEPLINHEILVSYGLLPSRSRNQCGKPKNDKPYHICHNLQFEDKSYRSNELFDKAHEGIESNQANFMTGAPRLEDQRPHFSDDSHINGIHDHGIHQLYSE